MTKDRCLVTCLALIIALPDASTAQEWNAEKKGEIVAVGVKYGLSTIRAIAATTDTTIPLPTPEITQTQRKGLEKVLRGYVDQRARSQGALIALKSGTEFFMVVRHFGLFGSRGLTTPASSFRVGRPRRSAISR
jgi:hypothetical protein